MDAVPNSPSVRPTYWQVVPCPLCKRKSWAVPWQPVVGVCCGAALPVVEVYLPFNPGGSAFKGDVGK